MKKMFLILTALLIASLLFGCSASGGYNPIAATTLPVFEFTSRICSGTDLAVTRLVNESLSCLHNYSLNVQQVRAAEAAEIVVINGAGLESFMDDILQNTDVIDASAGIEIAPSSHHHSNEGEDKHDGHDYEQDSHIWLSPRNAAAMAENIYSGLVSRYPQYRETFEKNLNSLTAELNELQSYGENQLKDLSCREMITFHDGFHYFAESFDLHIIRSIEEESGSEASAAELDELIGLVNNHHLPAIFTEKNGSDSAASVISQETGARIYSLDMAMSGESYFNSIRSNIDTIKEALG